MTTDILNPEDLTRAVVPLMTWSNILVDAGFDIPIGRSGTVFFISYDDELYAITATHCLNSTDPRELFIALPSETMKSLPLSTIINSSYKDCPHIGTEITVIKMPVVDLLIKRLGDFPYKLSQEMMCTPYFQRQIRLFRNGKIKTVYEIMNSPFCRNFKKSQDAKIQAAFEQVYTSELKILNLNLSDTTAKIPPNTECHLLGYPMFGWNIDYKNNSLATLFRGISCKFIKFDKDTKDYIFQYDTDEDLNGCSGGPILYNSKVVAVAHSINTNEKTIKATPFSKSFMKQVVK